jgi:poly(3-hydroxybutyrate) depolymerase
METPSFGIDTVRRNGRPVQVVDEVVLARPFWRLRRFRRKAAGKAESNVLVVSPLSGHFGWLMRDLVLGLLPRHQVSVVDWQDARDVPLSAGRFGIGENIAAVIEAARATGSGGGRPHVIGVSQAPTAVLAAAALMAADMDPARPRSVVLMGGFVDTRTGHTGVTRMASTLPRSWLHHLGGEAVPQGFAGAGRQVWSARVQGQALARYLARHVAVGGEVGRKVAEDDGADPVRFPFARLYSTLMDLPLELAEENLVTVFHRHALATGRMEWRGRPVDTAAIADIGLMTVEGGRDDSSGPGQTAAAHALCPRIPARLRAHHHQPDAGHFGLFHGTPWREGVLPRLEEFMVAVG